MSRNVVAAVAAGLVSLVVLSPAHATMCFPSETDGAATFSHGGDRVRFQAFVDTSDTTKDLVVKWSVKADAGAASVLTFGFFNDGGTPSSSTGNVFRIARKAGTAVATPDGGLGPTAATMDLEAFYWNAGLATPAWQVVEGLPRFPGWLSDGVRLEVTCGASGCDAWTLRLRVRLVGAGQGNFVTPSAASGLELGPTFKLWYELAAAPGGALVASSLELSPAVVATDPELHDPANRADETAAGGPNLPDTAKWMQASVDTSLSTCERALALHGGGPKTKAAGAPAGGAPVWKWFLIGLVMFVVLYVSRRINSKP